MILKNRWHCILCAREVKGHVRWTLLEINSDKIDSHGTQYSKDHVDHLRLLWSIRKQKSWTFGLSQGLCYKRYDPSASTFHFLLHLAPWAIWWPRSVCPVTFTLLPSLTLTQLTDRPPETRACHLTHWMNVSCATSAGIFLFSVFFYSFSCHTSITAIKFRGENRIGTVPLDVYPVFWWAGSGPFSFWMKEVILNAHSFLIIAFSFLSQHAGGSISFFPFCSLHYLLIGCEFCIFSSVFWLWAEKFAERSTVWRWRSLRRV